MEKSRCQALALAGGLKLQHEPYPITERCESDCQHIPFAATRAQRVASGDPGSSLEERRKTHVGYVKEVSKAAESLEKLWFPLPENVKRYIE